MQKTQLTVSGPDGQKDVDCTYVHTLVLGSGAAGLNAAVQLHASGVEDLLIVTEGLDKGTSINTGSDKQTYYKLGMYGGNPDSIESLADSFFQGGSMHGDLALCEASLSARAFLSLVNLGVPFPCDKHGQYVGYKTDHDPLQRATSVGPYCSRDMCRALIKDMRRRGIEVAENRLAVSLVTLDQEGKKRACGIVTSPTDGSGGLEAVIADNVVFAVGGPGGLYHTSVYPDVHTGAIGLALLEGAKAQSLPESQYGMASIKFRWNVSGTFMQVVPKFVSTDADGVSDAQEFLRPYFESVGEMNSNVFLKGYQWPFDPRKIVGGSSIIDILVYIETVLKKRRVFLDFRANPEGFGFDDLSGEAKEYLEKSDALLETPIARLEKMNPMAISLYLDNDIDIRKEPLEIAVCAQHNNGGLAANAWWESLNVSHLFPLGEVNGTHGVYRPGGSALNSGQVAGFRASMYIANRYRESDLDRAASDKAMADRVGEVMSWMANSKSAQESWADARLELQQRMTKAAAHIRSLDSLKEAAGAAREQWLRLNEKGCSYDSEAEAFEAFNTRQLCFAHLVYLEAVSAAVEAGVGSRGSALVLDSSGTSAHKDLGSEWCFVPEDPSFRNKVLETSAAGDGTVESKWIPRRPVPESDAWFESAWGDFRTGKIYE